MPASRPTPGPSVRNLAALLLTLGGGLACKDKGEDTGPAATSQRATVATYNAGLADNYVPWSNEREPFVTEALAELDVDLLCLQEVWQQESIDAIGAATSARLPEQLVEITAEAGADEPACTEEETTPLAECAHENCDGAPDLTTCVLSFCSDEFNQLSDGCTECAAANIGLNDVDAILNACLTGSSTFAWGGHNGLMLLSSSPMANTDRLDMDAWLVFRSALYAEVDGLSVVCTHLTADLGSVAYGGTAASYEAEQAAQIDAMIAWAEAKADGGPLVLLGDFNTGPALGGGIAAELPANWDKVTAAGFSDPNVDQDAPFCTWCVDNTLSEDSSDRAIDHVAVKGAATSNPVRLFDSTVDLPGADAPQSLSDHYGVQAELSW